MSLIKEATVAVITGTTSNLGLNIGYRLLEQVPLDKNLTIVVTSRTLPRVQEAITSLKEYSNTKTLRTGQLEFDYVLVDFGNMVSVLSAYHELAKRYTHIDYFFVNAAQTVYSGIDWWGATKEVLSNPVEGVTNPQYKIQKKGVKSQDGLGLMFQGNVFGPYYLLHKLQKLLANGGKVIWISSLMSSPQYFSFDDFQLLKTDIPYEGSKRMIDLVHFGSYKKLASQGIHSQLVQPGIFISHSFFVYLNVFTYYGMLMLFYLARHLGSTVHNISGYTAANAPVRSALHNEPQDVKLASSSDRWGKEYIETQQIDTTGAEDVVATLDNMVAQWDDRLKHQIVDSRQLN